MPPVEKIKVLLVDDRPQNLLAYESALEKLDLDLVRAESGDEALKHILANEFAVVLLDVNMPGIDGFETATLIRQRRKSAHTPIIFVTAFADEVRTAQGYASGAVDYLLSPVVPEILEAKVKVFVELFRMTLQVRKQGEERLALARERIERAAAEESNRLLRFLADVAAVVGKSLDDDATARDIARLCVPSFADHAVVARNDGSTGESKIVHAIADGDAARIEVVTDFSAVPQELADAVRKTIQASDAMQTASPAADGVRVAAFPISSESSIAAGWGISRDASRRPFSEAELAIAQAVASRAAMALQNAELYKELERADQQKNEFLSMLAHELRNPLAPIRNGVDLLRLQGPADESTAMVTDIIDRQTRHLVRLVDELLDISRITRGKIRLELELVDMAGVVAAAVETSRPVIEASEHELTVESPDETITVLCDRVRLVQIVANLLTNAAKYTQPKGKIALSLRREDGEAVFSVRDNGIGIPKPMLQKIFDLFTQVDRSLDRSQGGLGIGLTLVKRLVELHGGNVSASSEGPSRGSEFTVRLPLSATPAPAARPDTIEPASESGEELRMLVVDDNVDVATTAARLLRVRKHHVRTAHDGRAALELAATFQPHVVMLDLGLPELDGYEVARRLRALPEMRESLIIAVSGYGQEEDRRRTREAGFDMHFVKPVSYEAVLRAITETYAARCAASKA